MCLTSGDEQRVRQFRAGEITLSTSFPTPVTICCRILAVIAVVFPSSANLKTLVPTRHCTTPLHVLTSYGQLPSLVSPILPRFVKQDTIELATGKSFPANVHPKNALCTTGGIEKSFYRHARL